MTTMMKALVKLLKGTGLNVYSYDTICAGEGEEIMTYERAAKQELKVSADTALQDLVIKDPIDEYLSVSKYINWKDKPILEKTEEFKQKTSDEICLIPFRVQHWTL